MNYAFITFVHKGSCCLIFKKFSVSNDMDTSLCVAISKINMRITDLYKTIFTKISNFYKGKILQEYYVTHHFIL